MRKLSKTAGPAIFIFLSCILSTAAAAQYTLDLTGKPKKIVRGHLKMGGSDPSGNSISFTNYFMEINGKPQIPVIGEFHYLRYPPEQWEEEIRKMKAGGINLMATYLFWNLHEEEQGVFEWTGQRNVRRFIELCAKNNLWVIVRIGPFCHGEIRNGGLPDWLYGRPFEVRSNDEGYLAYVRRWYKQVGRQSDGLMFKDGGPIIAVQLENEYQHSAASWAFTYPGQPREYTAAREHQSKVLAGVGSKPEESVHSDAYGVRHMRLLKQMAENAGLHPAFFTATGWGGAAIIEHETLPVQAGYTYPTWAPPAPSHFYLFKDLQQSPDYVPAKYKLRDYPCFYAELGAGIQITYDRRPVVPPESVDPMIIRMLGSGANAIGYYMYHGGSTPQGKHSFMSEQINALPHISYDFQAPLGEFGQCRESFERLRVLHLFLHEFGSMLAPMSTVLPESAAGLKPTDTDTLRYAARTRDGSGFVFMVNFQDHVTTRDHKDIRLTLQLSDETLTLPEKPFTLQKDTAAILPFNFLMEGAILKYATAQLLARLHNDDTAHYVFFAPEGIDPEYVFDAATVKDIQTKAGSVRRKGDRWHVHIQPGIDSQFTLTASDTGKVLVTTLTYHQALHAQPVKLWGKERLILSDAVVMPDTGFLQFLQTARPAIEIAVWPDFKEDLKVSAGRISRSQNTQAGPFVRYEINLPAKDIQPQVQWSQKDKFTVKLPADAFEDVHELYLEIDWLGDTAMAFLDGRLLTEDFYIGRPWRIGLRRFTPELLDKGMYFYLKSMRPDAEWLIDIPDACRPDLSNGPVLKVRSVRIIPQYEVLLGREDS